jgi:hypothetical protein
VLKESEKRINEQNKRYRDGLSTFYEKLTEDSDLPMDKFKKEKEGAKFPVNFEGRGLGAISFLPPESEWYTSPELEELYSSAQNIPKSYDATTQGMSICCFHGGPCDL